MYDAFQPLPAPIEEVKAARSASSIRPIYLALALLRANRRNAEDPSNSCKNSSLSLVSSQRHHQSLCSARNLSAKAYPLPRQNLHKEWLKLENPNQILHLQRILPVHTSTTKTSFSLTHGSLLELVFSQFSGINQTFRRPKFYQAPWVLKNSISGQDYCLITDTEHEDTAPHLRTKDPSVTVQTISIRPIKAMNQHHLCVVEIDNKNPRSKARRKTNKVAIV